MIYKKIVTLLIVIFINACSSHNPYKNALPKDEKFTLYLKMGVRYLEMGQLKAAQEHLETALNIDAYSMDVHNALGVLSERLKNFADASTYYQRAMSLDSDNASIKNNYGRFLCEHDDPQQGIRILTDAVDMPLNARKWFAYTNIGLCKIKVGESEISENYFRQALVINKHYSPALFEMLKISYSKGQYMSARAFLERYLAVTQQNAEALWYAVQTERALGNITMATNYKNKLFSLFPASKYALQLKKY